MCWWWYTGSPHICGGISFCWRKQKWKTKTKIGIYVCARSVREKRNLFVQKESLYHLSIFRGKTCSLVFLHHFLSPSIDRSIDPVECPRSIRQCGPCVLNEILVWKETKFEEKKTKRQDKFKQTKKMNIHKLQVHITVFKAKKKSKICVHDYFFHFILKLCSISIVDIFIYIHIYTYIYYIHLNV